MKRIKLDKQIETTVFTDLYFNWYNIKSDDNQDYYRTDAIYKFTESEIDQIESATEELHSMCLDFVDDIVKSGDYRDYGFTLLQQQLIESSWKNNDKSLYGRFDFHLDPITKQLKLYEYNADTPTSLYEASIIQYEAMQSIFGDNFNQFNSIHEVLIETFEHQFSNTDEIYFSTLKDAPDEDWGNLSYIEYCCGLSGKNTSSISLEDIGYCNQSKTFRDLNNNEIKTLFKLYPLEYMTKDDFAIHLMNSSIKIVEPFWKLLLSNKLLMVKLWEQHKGHPNLLESYKYGEDLRFSKNDFIKKPYLSREGANVFSIGESEVLLGGSDFNEDYDSSRYIVQERVKQYTHDDFNVVIGSWVVNDNSVGIGIREDSNQVIGNNSHFVSHIFE